MIINLRGTSGSGKSTVVTSILDMYDAEPYEVNKRGKILSYSMETDFGDLYVIGSYANVCGGCDTITDIAVTRSILKKLAKKGHVLFEGLIVNNAYAGNRDIMQKSGDDYAFVFLDTPLRTCLSRVKSRRKKKGNDKPFNPDNTVKMYQSNLRMLERCVQDRANPFVIDHKNAVEELLQIFRGELT